MKILIKYKLLIILNLVMKSVNIGITIFQISYLNAKKNVSPFET